MGYSGYGIELLDQSKYLVVSNISNLMVEKLSRAVTWVVIGVKTTRRNFLETPFEGGKLVRKVNWVPKLPNV